MRVLLVEDDKLLAEGIEVALSLDHYVVDSVDTGEHALHALENEQFDLLVLDLGLPGISGYELLTQVRNNKNMTPVLILTARDHIDDKVKGLDLGADDYLLKPFDVAELKARMRALLRRPGGDRTPELVINDLSIDPQAHRVTRASKTISLSPKEFALLHELAMHKGRILSKEQLTTLVYGWSDDPDSNSIEVHIHNLRKKIGAGIVETVRGVGYRIDTQS